MTRPQPRVRADYKVFRPVPTRWGDNDIYGHMNNVVHYQLFDTAVNGWLLDIDALTLGANKVFFVGETNCRYFAQLHFPQSIEAGLRIVHLGRSSVRYEIGLFVVGQDDPAAEGEFIHIHVDRTENKSCPMDSAQREAMSAILVEQQTQ